MKQSAEIVHIGPYLADRKTSEISELISDLAVAEQHAVAMMDKLSALRSRAMVQSDPRLRENVVNAMRVVEAACSAYELARDEMVRRKLGAHVQQAVRIDAELGHMGLRLDLGLREDFALGLGRVLGLLAASAQLQGDVAVPLLSTLADDLAAVELKHSDRNVRAVIGEHAGHAQLLGDHARAHRIPPLSS